MEYFKEFIYSMSILIVFVGGIMIILSKYVYEDIKNNDKSGLTYIGIVTIIVCVISLIAITDFIISEIN